MTTRSFHTCLFAFACLLMLVGDVLAQGTIIIRPEESHAVFNNPGKGFTTFQMFNGDNHKPNQDVLSNFDLSRFENPGNDLRNTDYPQTTIAYFRIQWHALEPEQGKYRWDYVDGLLDLARQRGQTLMLRVSPYKWRAAEDVPKWYREMVGGSSPDQRTSNGFAHEKWIVDPEDPRYAQYYGGMIRALGKRYDGHPDMESIDVSLVGWAGEGGGTELLTDPTMKALMDAYLESFTQTPLVGLLHGKKSIAYATSKGNVGWRQDCLGDLGFWAKDQNGWTHMYDYYPQTIIEYNMEEAWKTAPVQFEICGVFNNWKDREGYGLKEVQYIFDQSLKWHISSFNAKSSPVPKEWQPLVDEWIKKMGYRFVLRRFSYPAAVKRNAKLEYESWWENKGVSPIYKNYPLAIRLINKTDKRVFITRAHIPKWLPGDNVYNDHIFVPADMKPGVYDVQLALIEPRSGESKIFLAIEGRDSEGWYGMGKIMVE